MSTSSMMLEHSLHSQQQPPTATPESQRESDRLKLLLDMTTTLVSTLECRDLLRTMAASIRQVMHCDIAGVWLPGSFGKRRAVSRFATGQYVQDIHRRYAVTADAAGGRNLRRSVDC